MFECRPALESAERHSGVSFEPLEKRRSFQARNCHGLYRAQSVHWVSFDMFDDLAHFVVVGQGIEFQQLVQPVDMVSAPLRDLNRQRLSYRSIECRHWQRLCFGMLQKSNQDVTAGINNMGRAAVSKNNH